MTVNFKDFADRDIAKYIDQFIDDIYAGHAYINDDLKRAITELRQRLDKQAAYSRNVLEGTTIISHFLPGSAKGTFYCANCNRNVSSVNSVGICIHCIASEFQ